MMNNFLNGMFGKVGNGMCRLSMNGGIAVKTSGGYKSYNIKTGKLTNCNNFVFDIGEEFFFVIPTNKVEKGDIILVNRKPKCVIDADNSNSAGVGGMNSMLPFMMMNGNMNDMFDGMFDFDVDSEEDTDEEEEA